MKNHPVALGVKLVTAVKAEKATEAWSKLRKTS